jgi:protein-S-isoprenylcysteine O-methyltransferase Ste14
MPQYLFEVLYLVGLIAAQALRLPQQMRNQRDWKRNTVRDKRLTGLERALILLLLMGMWVLPVLYVFTPWLAFADHHLPDWAGWLGAAIFIASFGLRWQAHRDLGHNYSSTLVVWEEHRLVTEGVYRYIQHPIYAALWLWVIAQSLLLHNWLAGLMGLVAHIPLYLLRVLREEAMMLEHFGEAYRGYVGRTGRVVPRLQTQQTETR